MLTHILKLMWRRRERLALVLLGILLVSFAAGLAASTARTTQGTVDEEVAKHWRTDYDLLVRPASSVSAMEKERGLISANYQTNLDVNRERISAEQLEIVRSLTSVEVAAPMTLVGYVEEVPDRRPYGDDLAPGFYRREVSLFESDGLVDITQTRTSHIVVGDWLIHQEPPGFAWQQYFPFFTRLDPRDWEAIALPRAGLDGNYHSQRASKYFLVAAIDPLAEAELTGLDTAMAAGEYFTWPAYEEHYPGSSPLYKINAVANQAVPVYMREETIFSRIDVPATHEPILAALRHPSAMYFFDLPAIPVAERVLEYDHQDYLVHQGARWLMFEPGRGVEYGQEGNYLTARSWGISRQNSTFRLSESWPPFVETSAARSLFREFGSEYSALEMQGIAIRGYFDPGKLDILPGDSSVSSPLEIYRFNSPEILEYGDGTRPIDPTHLQPSHALSYGGAPIGLLISGEALKVISGQDGWDSVRVRVAGVEELNERSQVRIAAVAQQIRDATGLHVDVVLGSSRARTPVKLYDYQSEAREQYRAAVAAEMEEIVPQIEAATGFDVLWDFSSFPDNNHSYYCLPMHSYNEQDDKMSMAVASLELHLSALREKVPEVPEFVSMHEFTDYLTQAPRGTLFISVADYQIQDDETRPLLGIVEEYWVQMGTTLRIFQETNRGTFWVTIGLLLVSALFIGNTTYISAIGKTGEYSVLRSLGWRRFTVFRSSLLETIAIALLAALATGAVLAAIWQFSDRYLEPWLMVLVAPVVFLTFVIGSLPPLLKTLSIQPLQGVRSGEVRAAAFGGAKPLGFVLRGLLSRPGRTLVTVFALTVPGAALAFMLHTYFGIQKLLGSSLLGEYVALEVQGHHFLLNALIFAVAGLAVTDTLLVNLRERQKEFGLLKALGWKDGTVASLLFWEGVGLGLLGGIIGSGLALGGYALVFSMLPANPVINSLLLAAVPALVGGLASVVPVIKARMLPVAQVLKEE